MRSATSTLTMPDGYALFTYTWLPDEDRLNGGLPRGTILIVHGYGEHAGRYDHVAEYFTSQGYAVYAFDQRGHGKSRGAMLGYVDNTEIMRDDIYRIYEWVRTEQKTGPLFMLGHSFGGLMSLYFATKYQSLLKALVITDAYVPSSSDFSAVQRVAVRTLAGLVPKFGPLPPVDSKTLSKDPKVAESYDADPNVYHGKVPAKTAVTIIDTGDKVRTLLPKITLPILVMHGGSDPLANPVWSQYVYEHLGSADKSIKIYDGLYHEILNEPERARVMADIWVWLAAHQGTGELRPVKTT
jgi:acylglycerol lipase